MNALACRLNNTSTLNSACTRLSPKRNAEARSPSRLDGPGARSVSWACRSEAPPNDYSVPGTLTTDLEHAMKYLCLAYEEEKKLNALSQSEWERPQERDPGLCRGPAEERSLDRHARTPKRSDRQHRAGSKRQAVGDRRPLRRDQGAAGRVLPDRCQGPERGHPGRVAVAVGAPWEYRGAADRGRAQAGQAPRVSTIPQQRHKRTLREITMTETNVPHPKIVSRDIDV